MPNPTMPMTQSANAHQVKASLRNVGTGLIVGDVPLPSRWADNNKAKPPCWRVQWTPAVESGIECGHEDKELRRNLRKAECLPARRETASSTGRFFSWTIKPAYSSNVNLWLRRAMMVITIIYRDWLRHMPARSTPSAVIPWAVPPITPSMI